MSTKCLMAATLGLLTWISLALPLLLLLWAQPLSQPQGTTLGPSRQLGALRPALGCSACPSSSPTGETISLHLCNYRIAVCLLTSFGVGLFPGLISVGLVSSCDCPTCCILLRTWPDLLHPSLLDGHSRGQAPPCHGTEKLAASDFLGLTVSPCHHPPDTCGQRDSRKSQEPIHTDAKLWFPMAPGLKSNLVMEFWGP